MGQTIEVKSILMGEVALFDTDRTMTGQDGRGFRFRRRYQRRYDHRGTAGC